MIAKCRSLAGSALVWERCWAYSAAMSDLADVPSSLYAALAECPDPGSPSGETRNTRQKETVDNDVEEFDPELVPGSVYDLVARSAPVDFVAGETKITKKMETVDEEPDDHCDCIT